MKEPDIARLASEHADRHLDRAHVPYSGKATACVAVLADGSWIPGVRVETASFSLRISAIQNAVSSAVAMGREDVSLVVATGDVSDEQNLDYLRDCAAGHFSVIASGVYASTHRPHPESLGALVSPFLMRPESGIAEIDQAREVARRAYCPESNFPVGCVATAMNYSVPGVNVEHVDWSRIICAERNAIGTLITYGLGPANRIALSCPEGANCSPCGACRQVLAELAPDADLVTSGKSSDIIVQPVNELLPNAFVGDTLRKIS